MKNWMLLSKRETAGIHNTAQICLQCKLTSTLVNVFAMWIGSLFLHILKESSNGTLKLWGCLEKNGNQTLHVNWSCNVMSTITEIMERKKKPMIAMLSLN